MGWRDITGPGVGADPGTRRWVYFVHSYVLTPRDPAAVTAIAHFGDVAFPAMVRCGNVAGLQFHPEKSGTDGLALLAHALGVASSDRQLHES